MKNDNKEVLAMPGECTDNDNCIFTVDCNCDVVASDKYEKENGLKSCIITGVIYVYKEDVK